MGSKQLFKEFHQLSSDPVQFLTFCIWHILCDAWVRYFPIALFKLCCALGILMAGQVAAIKLRQFIDPAPETIPGTIFRQGKDVIGYYTGQLARLHIAYPPERQLRPFTKLQLAPEKGQIIYPHEFDYLMLQQYIHYQSAKMKVFDWYTRTTYKEAFMLPCFKSGSAEDCYRHRSDAEILSLWKSTSAMKKDRVKPSFMGV